MLIIFMDRGMRTVPLVQYNLYGEYNNEWNTALAAMMLAVTPCIIFFIFMQKYIVRGITSGSVKG
jgi:raffinose/stachyose/melibiose transport system permease protein